MSPCTLHLAFAECQLCVRFCLRIANGKIVFSHIQCSTRVAHSKLPEKHVRFHECTHSAWVSVKACGRKEDLHFLVRFSGECIFKISFVEKDRQTYQAR